MMALIVDRKTVAHNVSDNERTKDIEINEKLDFSSLFLSNVILEGLRLSGFVRPSPIQLKAIPLGRCGLDLIVQAKSGTGKTCVFTVIALDGLVQDSTAAQVLVLAPTREIAVQIQEVVLALGCCMATLRCQTFIGGMPLSEDRQKIKNCQIIIGTPGRVKQLIEEDILRTDAIRLFILDEADKLLEESFQKQVNWIYSSLPENKQLLALSATYPEYLAQHLTAYMRDPTFIRLNCHDPALLGIKQFYKTVAYHPLPNKTFDDKCSALMDILSHVTFQQCLVFSNYQTRAEDLCNLLDAAGWPSSFIAGRHDQRSRNQTMQKLKTFKCRILVSTDLTSRGIDCDKVNLVVNLDIPHDHETYLHRIGRAGRFGSFGAAVTLVSLGKELTELKKVEHKCNTNIKVLPDPIPTNLTASSQSVCLDDLVSSHQIITTSALHGSTTAENDVVSPHQIITSSALYGTTTAENDLISPHQIITSSALYGSTTAENDLVSPHQIITSSALYGSTTAENDLVSLYQIITPSALHGTTTSEIDPFIENGDDVTLFANNGDHTQSVNFIAMLAENDAHSEHWSNDVRTISEYDADTAPENDVTFPMEMNAITKQENDRTTGAENDADLSSLNDVITSTLNGLHNGSTYDVTTDFVTDNVEIRANNSDVTRERECPNVNSLSRDESNGAETSIGLLVDNTLVENRDCVTSARNRTLVPSSSSSVGRRSSDVITTVNVNGFHNNAYSEHENVQTVDVRPRTESRVCDRFSDMCSSLTAYLEEDNREGGELGQTCYSKDNFTDLDKDTDENIDDVDNIVDEENSCDIISKIDIPSIQHNSRRWSNFGRVKSELDLSLASGHVVVDVISCEDDVVSMAVASVCVDDVYKAVLMFVSELNASRVEAYGQCDMAAINRHVACSNTSGTTSFSVGNCDVISLTARATCSENAADVILQLPSTTPSPVNNGDVMDQNADVAPHADVVPLEIEVRRGTGTRRRPRNLEQRSTACLLQTLRLVDINTDADDVIKVDDIREIPVKDHNFNVTTRNPTNIVYIEDGLCYRRDYLSTDVPRNDSDDSESSYYSSGESSDSSESECESGDISDLADDDVDDDEEYEDECYSTNDEDYSAQRSSETLDHHHHQHHDDNSIRKCGYCARWSQGIYCRDCNSYDNLYSEGSISHEGHYVKGCLCYICANAHRSDAAHQAYTAYRTDYRTGCRNGCRTGYRTGPELYPENCHYIPRMQSCQHHDNNSVNAPPFCNRIPDPRQHFYESYYDWYNAYMDCLSYWWNYRDWYSGYVTRARNQTVSAALAHAHNTLGVYLREAHRWR